MYKNGIRYIVLFAIMLLLIEANGYKAYCSVGKTYTKDHPLLIEGNWEFPPYEYLDEQGNANGFDIDLMKALLDEMNIPYVIILKDWADALNDMRKGKADLICATYGKRRAKDFLFSKTVITYIYEDYAYLKGRKRIHSFKEIGNKKIILHNQSMAHIFMREEGLDSNLIPVSNMAETLKKLSEGKTENVIWCREPIKYFIRKYHLNNIKLADIGIPTYEFRFISKDQTLLDNLDFTYSKMNSDGSLDEIYFKWFNSRRESYIPHYIFYSIGILLVLLLILYIFNLMLKKKIRETKKVAEVRNNQIRLALRAKKVQIWGYNVKKEEFYNIEGNILPAGPSKWKDIKGMFIAEDFIKFSSTIQRLINGEIDEAQDVLRFKYNEYEKEWLNIEKVFKSIRDKDGKITTIIGTHRNITNEILRHEKIKALTLKYRIIFDNTIASLAYYDNNGFLVEMNNETCKMFGIKDKRKSYDNHINLFNNPYLYFLDRKHPDAFYGLIKCDHDFFREKGMINDTKNGNEYIELRLNPIYDNLNNLQCIITTCLNLTKEKEIRDVLKTSTEKLHKTTKEIANSIERINYVLKTSNIQIWEYDLKDKMLSITSDVTNRLVSLSAEECINEIDDAYKSEMRKSFSEMDNMTQNVFSKTIKFNNTIFEQGEHYLIIDSVPIKDNKGQITSYFGLKRDVTEKMHTQIELENKTAKAQEADKLKSAFLANMSHEIRTPLNAIVGFSNMLGTTNDKKEKEEFIRIIKSNSDQLLRLINEALELSKINVDILAIRPKEIDVSEAFNVTCETLAQRITNANVKFIKDNPYTSCVALVDYYRISQIITNFVNNAAKYTMRGYIKAGYEYINDGLRFYGEDTGVGIPKEQCDMIFERFVKLNDFVQGSGLGLSICKAIVERCNGNIGVDSALGKGTTMWAWIPCKAAIK